MRLKNTKGKRNKKLLKGNERSQNAKQEDTMP